MARFRHVTADIDWTDFKGDSVIFPVCMKSPAVYGRSLKAQLHTAKERVNNLNLVICDTLDRHNYSFEATDLTLRSGDNWLDKYMPTVQEFFPDVNILRWERDIRSHPDFEHYFGIMKDLYNISSAYRELRDNLAMYYVFRKYKRHQEEEKQGRATKGFDKQAAFYSCADYLDEEFAGDIIYSAITGCNFRLYWGLYVSDTALFARESGKDIFFPETIPVTVNKIGSSVSSCELEHQSLKYVA